MGEFMTEPQQSLAQRVAAGSRGRHDPLPGPAGQGDGHEAAAILECTRASVDPELRRALGSLPGSLRR
ncbi:MAG: polyprenyl synthetase family protein, partial [Streptomyces sp.]|nr:polyprenyl synthetase family protein [Streptomyces sp.]